MYNQSLIDTGDFKLISRTGELLHRGRNRKFVVRCVSGMATLYLIKDSIDERPFSDNKGFAYRGRLKDCRSLDSLMYAIAKFDNAKEVLFRVGGAYAID